MDKHEVLKKARQSQEDEREKRVEKDSFRFSWMGVILAITILMAVRIYHNESTADLIVITMVQFASRALYQFIKVKDTYHLFALLISIGGLLLAVFALLSDYGVY